MKLLELFCGAGSFSYGMTRNGLKHEIVGFSDIRDSAIKVFCDLHNKKTEENLGDVKNINAKSMVVDLITFGSPCQSFTRAGKVEGGEKGSNTKSSLMWEAVRIINECNPKIVIWENVPDATSKKNMKNFQNYLDEMNDCGYNSYYEILNANILGSAQKRKRLFVVSILKELDNGEFEFLIKKEKQKELADYLVDSGNKNLIVEEHINKALILGKEGELFKIKNATKAGFALAAIGDIVDTSFYNSKTRRGRVQNNSCPTLLRSKSVSVLEDGYLRYLSPKEYWLLQEMKEKDYQIIENNLSKDSQKYDVVGGVINQKHLDCLFTSLRIYLENNENFNIN